MTEVMGSAQHYLEYTGLLNWSLFISFYGSHQFCFKLLEVGNTKIFEFAPLEQIPHAFLRIEFGCVAWQAFQMDAFGSAPAEKILDHQASVNMTSGYA